MHDPKQELIDEINEALNQSVERIDGATLSRLNRARHEAMEQAGRRVYAPRWLAAGTATAVLVAGLAAWLSMSAPDSAFDTDEQAAFIASTSSLTDEDMDLIEELDFFTWLIEEEHAG